MSRIDYIPLSTVDAVVLSIPPINERTYKMLDVVKKYLKQKTLCNSVDFYSFEIDADRIAAGHGFEDEREGIPFGPVLLKKALVKAKIWQLMEVVNRQKRIPNQPQFLVVMDDESLSNLSLSLSLSLSPNRELVFVFSVINLCQQRTINCLPNNHM